jgi:hypothetical protein
VRVILFPEPYAIYLPHSYQFSPHHLLLPYRVVLRGPSLQITTECCGLTFILPKYFTFISYQLGSVRTPQIFRFVLKKEILITKYLCMFKCFTGYIHVKTAYKIQNISQCIP